MHRAATLAILASGLFCCGCGTGGGGAGRESVELEPLMRVLGESWPQSSADIRMTASWKEEAGRGYLHCRLENTSARTLELNASALPWKTPGLFSFAALTARGEYVYATTFVESVMAGPEPISLIPGQTIEGDIDAKFLPAPITARSRELVLVWKHGVAFYPREAGGAAVSGITFLPKNSQ
jgi:hypothetical protein